RQHGRRGQAKSEQETTASDAHTSSLSRWPASVLTDCRKATLTSILSPRERRSACPMLGKRLPFPIGRRSGSGYLNSNLWFRLVKKLACFFVRWLSRASCIEELPRGVGLPDRPGKDAAPPLPISVGGEGTRDG